jgi:hypothetical protein
MPKATFFQLIVLGRRINCIVSTIQSFDICALAFGILSVNIIAVADFEDNDFIFSDIKNNTVVAYAKSP